MSVVHNDNRAAVRSRSVIIRAITKSDDREAGVRFSNHAYGYRPTSDDTKCHYQLVTSITISEDYCQGCDVIQLKHFIGSAIKLSDYMQVSNQ